MCVFLLPEISTTLRDEAEGNFSFRTLAMRTSPSVSVCEDRCLRTGPSATTWGGRRRAAVSDRLPSTGQPTDRPTDREVLFTRLVASRARRAEVTVPVRPRLHDSMMEEWSLFMRRSHPHWRSQPYISMISTSHVLTTAAAHKYDVTHPGTWWSYFSQTISKY